MAGLALRLYVLSFLVSVSAPQCRQRVRPRARAFVARPLGPAPRVTRPRCSGGSPEVSVHPIRHGESAERLARLPHLMRVGRLSQGGQWPMYPHLAARLLCCALLSERGVVQHWGSKSWRQHERVWWRGSGSGNGAAEWLQSLGPRPAAWPAPRSCALSIAYAVHSAAIHSAAAAAARRRIP
jgi:hypothetical protein